MEPHLLFSLQCFKDLFTLHHMQQLYFSLGLNNTPLSVCVHVSLCVCICVCIYLHVYAYVFACPYVCMYSLSECTTVCFSIHLLTALRLFPPLAMATVNNVLIFFYVSSSKLWGNSWRDVWISRSSCAIWRITTIFLGLTEVPSSVRVNKLPGVCQVPVLILPVFPTSNPLQPL